MEYCRICGERSYTSVKNPASGLYEPICKECYHRERMAEIERRGDETKQACDFKDWDHGDFSDLFWLHLGRYVKHPNRHSLDMMRRAFCWACHEDHGLSANFDNALKWCKLDLHAEAKRKDLPEDYKESGAK